MIRGRVMVRVWLDLQTPPITSQEGELDVHPLTLIIGTSKSLRVKRSMVCPRDTFFTVFIEKYISISGKIIL